MATATFHRKTLIFAAALPVLLLSACANQTVSTSPSKPVDSQPTQQLEPIAAPPPQQQAESIAPTPPEPLIEQKPPGTKPATLETSPWATLREPFDTAEKVTLDCKWTGGRRLEVHTENVQRLTLDLHHLPREAPAIGPWILQIDRQGIEISGRRGKVIDLVRSPNGVWSVDRDKTPQRR